MNELQEWNPVDELKLGEVKEAVVIGISTGERNEFFKEPSNYPNTKENDKMVRISCRSVDGEEFFTTYKVNVSEEANLGKFFARYKVLKVGVRVMAVRGNSGRLGILI